MINPMDSRYPSEQLWHAEQQIKITRRNRRAVLRWQEEDEGELMRGYHLDYPDPWDETPTHLYLGMGGAMTATMIYNWITKGRITR